MDLLPVQQTKENANSTKTFSLLKMWLETAAYSAMVLSGQSSATLLGRLYYDKGGKSKYIAALMQSAGFPLLLPLVLYLQSRKNPGRETGPPPSHPAVPLLYICFGIFLAFDSMLYSLGLMHLPLSTFSLICSSQLAFNALFSYFINSQKLTPITLNSIFLLTLSPVLLFLHPEHSPDTQGRNRVLGFICTAGGAAGYALLLSVEQQAYRRVLKRQGIREIVTVIFFESMATTCALLVGLFAGGEWRGLRAEAAGFGLGGWRGYAAVVAAAAVGWQVFAVGMVALVLKVSSLFGNVVSTMGVPVVPVLAVVVFKDRMSGLKAVAMVLAVWGSVSYVYQQYLDDVAKEEKDLGNSLED